MTNELWIKWEKFVSSQPPYGHQLLGLLTGALVPFKFLPIPIGMFITYQYSEDLAFNVPIQDSKGRNTDIGEFLTFTGLGLLFKELYKEYK